MNPETIGPSHMDVRDVVSILDNLADEHTEPPGPMFRKRDRERESKRFAIRVKGGKIDRSICLM